MKTNRRTKRAARGLYRLCVVDGALDADRVRLVADRLAASRRRGALAAFAGFLRLVRLDRDRHTVMVESAAPLAEDLREQLQTSLARAGAGTAAFVENPALIGGIRIKVGSDVYDDSVRARLAALAARL